MDQMKTSMLERRAAVCRLLADRRDLLIVTGLGSASYDVTAAGDNDLNYYLWAAMGSAAMVGLGLAHARPDRPVLVVTGDEEMMMGLGAIATIAVQAPANLTIAVIDNGQFGETGMQTSHAGRGIELDRIAQACGVSWTTVIRDMAGIDELRERMLMPDGVKLATIKVRAENPERALPPRDGVFVKNRFRAALGYGPI